MDEVSYWAKSGEVEHLHDHGRHAAEGGDPLTLDQLEGPLGIEVVHHDDLSAGADVSHHDGVAPGGVEERDREQDGALHLVRRVDQRSPEAQLAPRVDEEEVHQVGADVAVGADGALGASRGARGVEDGGVVLRVDGDVGGRGVGIDRRRAPGRTAIRSTGGDPSGGLRTSQARRRSPARCSSATMRAVSPVQPAEEGADASRPAGCRRRRPWNPSPPGRSAAPRPTTRR